MHQRKLMLIGECVQYTIYGKTFVVFTIFLLNRECFMSNSLLAIGIGAAIVKVFQ